MKPIIFLLSSICMFLITGCMLPGYIQPLRLYDVESGNKIEVILHPTSNDHGKIISYASSKNEYSGEYFIYNRSINWRDNGEYPRQSMMYHGLTKKQTEHLAELYGFSKNADARPAGTGIIVGNDSTVIQIIFYKIADDFHSGDGVGVDNKDRYYRIFLSTEEQ